MEITIKNPEGNIKIEIDYINKQKTGITISQWRLGKNKKYQRLNLISLTNLEINELLQLLKES